MGAATLASIEEYLRTGYDPDCEYLDGRIVERNLGEKPHSRILRKLIVYLDQKAAEYGIEVFPEQRVQVSPTRFRVPDVTVVRLPQTQEAIITRRRCCASKSSRRKTRWKTSRNGLTII